MPGFPAPFVQFHAHDANGFPLAGGKLYSYAAGTSTPLATYTTQALDVPNANPTILDASGRASIWVQDGVGYKFVQNDKLDTLVWSMDNVQVPQIAAAATATVVPTGGIIIWPTEVAPAGWLICDGRTVSKSEYLDLFNAIGIIYGGSGSTFQLPDLRARFVLGKADTGTGSALGEKAGMLNHTHAGPSHTHPMAQHQHSIPAHEHKVPAANWGNVLSNPDIAGKLVVADGTSKNWYHPTVDQTTYNGVATMSGFNTGAGLATDAGGTGQTGQANPPFIALFYIIKT
jgi:microcystin-dependent protein